MSAVFIQSAVFAAIFFIAGLILKHGDLLHVLLMTLVATAVYAVLTALFAGARKKRL